MTKPDEPTERDGLDPEAANIFPESTEAPLSPDEERLVDAIDRAEEGEDSSPYLKVIQTLKQAPVAAAPPDFLRQVQTKIREQSGGRYYGFQWKSRLPSGLLMLLMLVVVILLAYMLARPTTPSRPIGPTRPPSLTPEQFSGLSDELGLAAAVLSGYGDIQNEGITADGRHRQLAVELPKARISAFEADISLYPTFQIVGEPEATLDPNSVLMRIQVPLPAPKK